jgi:hypothetical protein
VVKKEVSLFTTEGTEATEADRKGMGWARAIRTSSSHPISVFSVLSAVKKLAF